MTDRLQPADQPAPIASTEVRVVEAEGAAMRGLRGRPRVPQPVAARLASLQRHRLALIGMGFFLLMTAVAIIGPIVWPYDPTDIPGSKIPGGEPPTLSRLKNILGTDFGGRSVLQFVVVGARISVAVGFFTMVIATTIGSDGRGHRRVLRRLGRRAA